MTPQQERIRRAREHADEVANIFLHDPHGLADFIRALVFRYNGIVEQINRTVEDIPPMKTISESREDGDLTEQEFRRFLQKQGLSTRIANCLVYGTPIRSRAALMQITDAELLRIKNFGKWALREFNEWRDRNDDRAARTLTASGAAGHLESLP
jgi:hypothetical protein